MLCQECRRRQASVKITTIVNNQKAEVHLCQECASTRGELEFGGEAGISLGGMLAALLHHQGLLKQATESDQLSPRCPNCGLSYERFTKQGKLGCSECFGEFERQLRGVLRHVHGSTKHVGRSPRRAGGTMRLERQVANLRAQLGKAVEAEDFERAAEIRDQLRQLESDLRAMPASGIGARSGPLPDGSPRDEEEGSR